MKLLLLIIFFTPLASFAEGLIAPSKDLNNTEVSTKEISSESNFNFKVNVLGVLFGIGDVSLEYKLTPKFTISGALIFGGFTQESKNSIYKFDIKTFGGNIRTNYYFNEAFEDSFYLSILAGMLKFDVDLTHPTLRASSQFSSAYIGANTGYAWHWKHFNINLGLGYNHSFEDKDAIVNFENITGTTTVRVQYNLILEAVIGISF